MPVYDYSCRVCGSIIENVVRSAADSEFGPECCGRATGVTWTAMPGTIARRFEPYLSPCDGRPITTEAARRDDLAQSGCIPYEPGIRQDQDRRAREHEVATDRLIGDIVGRSAAEIGITDKLSGCRE